MPGTFSNILFHIIFSTKHREPFITPALRDRLYPFVGGIVRDERGTLLTIGGMSDHVHLLVISRTDGTVADLVRHVKSRSSLWVHEEYKDQRAFGWQEGYAVFSVAESGRDEVRRYIENQEEHHRKKSYEDEYLAFLKANKVEFDPRYVFD